MTARVRRRAHGAAVPSDERLQRGGGVHVGDRHQLLDVGDRGQGVPRLFDRVDVGHVGHGATGVEVGEDHLLVVGGEDVGRLGHEVHTAEHDVVGGAVVGRQPGQPEGVAPGVGPAHDLVALVVVAEDHQPRPERRLGRRDPCGQGVVGCAGVALGERRLDSEHEERTSAEELRLRPAGTAWSPIRGVVGLGADMSPETRPACRQCTPDGHLASPARR